MMDLAYLAGFFDGEGSIGVYPTDKGWHLRTQVTQNDTPEARLLLDQCAAAFGGHVSVLRSPSRANPALNWQVHGDRASAMLASLMPYLRLKRRQAEIAVAFQSQPRGHRHDGAEVASQMKALKRPWISV